MSEPLLRYKIDISNVDHINATIQGYQTMIEFYENWLNLNGEYEYVSDRISYLFGVLSEYLIAREFAQEGLRTYGGEST